MVLLSSPQPNIVLKLAHKVDDSTPAGSVPSKDCLVDTVIFKADDIITVDVKDVDLDYAVKSESCLLSMFVGCFPPSMQ